MLHAHLRHKNALMGFIQKDSSIGATSWAGTYDEDICLMNGLTTVRHVHEEALKPIQTCCGVPVLLSTFEDLDDRGRL